MKSTSSRITDAPAPTNNAPVLYSEYSSSQSVPEKPNTESVPNSIPTPMLPTMPDLVSRLPTME